MIQSMNFNVGTRDGKWYALWDDPDGKMEGPARDTEAEALADRDRATQLAVMALRKHIPGATVTTKRIQ
jgi:predicted RNase H-like HicB family nuclease